MQIAPRVKKVIIKILSLPRRSVTVGFQKGFLKKQNDGGWLDFTQGVNAVGFSGKRRFFFKDYSFQCKVFGASNFGLVLGNCIVNAMIIFCLSKPLYREDLYVKTVRGEGKQ